MTSVVFLLTACGTGSPSTDAKTDTSSAIKQDTSTEKNYDIALVNNKKDPSCGMPVTAGISDTAHYKNYVLGFCSTECKNEFLKNPEANLAAAEIK
jgi:YHS domain-containing protein